MLTITNDLIDRFRRLVYDKSDLYFADKKLVFFERRLRERLMALGLADYEDYCALLARDPLELGMLVQDLTTNKTHFFRDRAQFRALRDTVLPGLVEARNLDVMRTWGSGAPSSAPGRNPAMSIRIWSSGCSTGEEAYSIAFMLLDTVRYPRAWDLEVLATDINRAVLDTARRGVYGDDAVRELEPDVRDRYMRHGGDGWKVRDDARSAVAFREGNIKELSGPGGRRTLVVSDPAGRSVRRDLTEYFDVIFCRNVMIYFDRDAQQRLVDALYGCLKPGGFLFTGDSEPLHLFSHGFTRAHSGEALYYRKPI